MPGQIVKRGDGKWLVRISLGADPQTGKRQYFSKTIHGPKKDAERYLAKALSERDLGTFAGPSKVTMNELFDDLLQDYQINGMGSECLRRPSIAVEKHLRPFLGKVPAARLTSDLVNRYIHQRQTDGVGNVTINRVFNVFKRSLSLGREATPPKVLNVLKIAKLKEAPPRAGFFEHEEFLAMRQELPDHLRPMVTFAYYTGCRVGEILSLRWHQVDLARQVVRLDPGTTKNNEARSVPLDGELLETLSFQRQMRDERYPDCPWVFFRDGKQIDKYFQYQWKQAAMAAATRERAPVASLWDSERQRSAKLFHDLRRTGVRNMVRAGVSEKVAMRISGHKTRSVFDRYNIVNEEDIRDAGRKLSEYIQAKGQRETGRSNLPARPESGNLSRGVN